MQRCSNLQEEPANGRKFVQGLLIGLAAAIPLWAALGVVGILYFQEGPIRGYQRIALLVAALVEVFLLAYVKRTMLLAGLVGAYLHYYFWDVQLQVAFLRRVVVFVPVYATG